MMFKPLMSRAAFRRVKLAMAGGLAAATLVLVPAGQALASTSGVALIDGCTAGAQMKSYVDSNNHRWYYGAGTLTCPNRHYEFAVRTTIKVFNSPTGSVIVSSSTPWTYFYNSYGMGSHELDTPTAYSPGYYFQAVEQVLVSDNNGASWTSSGTVTTGSPTYLG